MATDIVGSRMRSQTGRGMNQDQTPSSVAPRGRTRSRNKSKRHGIEFAPIPNVSPPNAVLPDRRGADTIGERVHGTPVATHAAMAKRSSDGTVPGNDRPVKK